MAVAQIFEGAGVTQAQYDAVSGEVAPDNKLPSGMLYHAAGPMDGGWWVVNVFESQEAADKFVADKLGQSLQKHGVTGELKTVAVHNIYEA